MYEASAAVCSKVVHGSVVVDSLFIVAPDVCGCLVLVL